MSQVRYELFDILFLFCAFEVCIHEASCFNVVHVYAYVPIFVVLPSWQSLKLRYESVSESAFCTIFEVGSTMSKTVETSATKICIHFAID